MNVNELQADYNSGGSTWTKHGADGLAPNSIQYDLDGNAGHHITVFHNAVGEITGIHYTIRNAENTLFHMYYYKDNNTYSVDFQGTRNPKTIDTGVILTRLAGWCLASLYSANANTGKITNLKAFQTRIADLEKDVPKAQKTKKGIRLDLTGGGGRRY